jgi:ATP-dependent RNA helicase DDX18/HAS1
MEQSSKASKISRKNMKKMNKHQSDSDAELDKDDVDQKLNKKTIQNLNLTKSEKKEIQKEKSKNLFSKNTPNKENNQNNDDDRDNVNLKSIIQEEENESENQEDNQKKIIKQNIETEGEKEPDSEESAEGEKTEDSNMQKDKYFSNIKFEEFDINIFTLQSLTELGFKTATEIQAKTIPLSLSGADIIGSAKTGSGKSLAFLIPAVETIVNQKDKAGTKVLILTPTRELALQLYNLAKDLLMHHKETCALTIGGANRKVEAEKLKSGASIVIATPGRILDHMKNTKGFNFQNLSMLVIDEADAILKIGFEQELKEIVGLLPKKRQTLLFSATMNNKLDDIIRLSVHNPIQISTKSHVATVTNLEQGYVVIEPDKKFLLLYTFLRKNPNKKIIVFFASCKEVEFFAHLLNYVDIPAKSTHGGQKQQKRTATFFEFSNMEQGILLCTDVVQRGLDFPDVDWIIQYDPPHSK